MACWMLLLRAHSKFVAPAASLRCLACSDLSPWRSRHPHCQSTVNGLTLVVLAPPHARCMFARLPSAFLSPSPVHHRTLCCTRTFKKMSALQAQQQAGQQPPAAPAAAKVVAPPAEGAPAQGQPPQQQAQQQAEKKDKKKEEQPGQERPPGKCQFFLEKKRRFCKFDVVPGQHARRQLHWLWPRAGHGQALPGQPPMRLRRLHAARPSRAPPLCTAPAAGKRFCGNHLFEGEGSGPRRVPCPWDPRAGHTVLESELEKHKFKCPGYLQARLASRLLGAARCSLPPLRGCSLVLGWLFANGHCTLVPQAGAGGEGDTRTISLKSFHSAQLPALPVGSQFGDPTTPTPRPSHTHVQPCCKACRLRLGRSSPSTRKT